MTWSILVPVVIGGLLTLLGSVIGQFLTHTLTHSRERSKIREERIERMVSSVWAHAEWLNDRKNADVFGEHLPQTPDPLSEARMLQELYFPNLRMQMVGIALARISIELQIAKHQSEKAKGDPTRSKLLAEIELSFPDLFVNHSKAVGEFIEACRKLTIGP